LHVAKFSQGAKVPKKVVYTSPGEGQRSCKVWLASGERRRCTNEAKTRNRLKFAGVPKTRQQISAFSAPKFAILCEHLEEMRCRCLTSFFPIVDTCLRCEDVVGQSCAMVCRWRFLRNFCVLCFQPAACSTFHTCILNSH